MQSWGVQRLEISGEELAVGRLEIVLQHLLTGIEGSAHDGDDAAELAVGTEIADALDLLFGEFSHIGIAGSHRFCGRETGSLHIGNGLDRKIFGGKRDRCDGHSDDGLFGRMAMVAPWADWTGWGCVQPEGRFSVKWSVLTSSASAADAQRRIPRRQVAVSVRTFCI